jgi:two-component system, response regulator YesN
MWKVLIADDEPKIRRGLASLVATCEGFEVVAEAEDGEMAMDMARRELPDLLLVDVRMPFKSGIELVSDINAELPGRVVIIVSGHDEFEYAQAAVKLKAFDFILKPVDAEAFRAAMTRAKAELESKRDSDKYLSWAKDQLERSLPLLRERFFFDWISGGLSKTELDGSLAFLEIGLRPPLTLLAARFPEGPSAGSPPSDRGKRLALVAMRAILSDMIPPGAGYVFEDGAENVLALLNGFSETELIEAANEIERRVSSQVFQVPSVATRPLSDPATAMSDAYEELIAELSDGGNCESFVVLARNYIDAHYWEPDLCLENAASELQISPGYLSRLMKRETGFSFVEYLNRIRVRKATQLMADPSAKAFEVAERVGYRSQHYFSRAFKKVTGTSPTDHRKGTLA